MAKKRRGSNKAESKASHPKVKATRSTGVSKAANLQRENGVLQRLKEKLAAQKREAPKKVEVTVGRAVALAQPGPSLAHGLCAATALPEARAASAVGWQPPLAARWPGPVLEQARLAQVQVGAARGGARVPHAHDRAHFAGAAGRADVHVRGLVEDFDRDALARGRGLEDARRGDDYS